MAQQYRNLWRTTRAFGTWSKPSLMMGMVLLLTATAACTAPPSNSSSESASSAASPTNSPADSSTDSSTDGSTASPEPVPEDSASKDASPASEQEQAAQVIHDYYRAIAIRDYEQAYSLWQGDGVASEQTLEEFKQGFAQTSSVSVEVGEVGEVEGAAGSLYVETPVTVTSVTTTGTPQRFCGSYVLRRVNDVPGSTPEQRQWHLYSADLSQC